MISNAGRRLCVTANLRKGFSDGSVDKESACNARDIGNAVLILGSGRTPEGKWQPTPVFLPEKFHGQRSQRASDSFAQLKRLSTHTCVAFKELTVVFPWLSHGWASAFQIRGHQCMIPGWGTRIPQAEKQLGPCTGTTEHMCSI